MSEMKAIPPGYHTVQPYLIVSGCAEAISFYQRAFGATEVLRTRNQEGAIRHSEIRIGDSVVMMADEHPQIQAFGPAHYGGSPVSLLIYVESCDSVYRQALDAGAESLREPADQPYGDRMAGVRDPFGYSWWIATHIQDVPRAEVEAMGQHA